MRIQSISPELLELVMRSMYFDNAFCLYINMFFACALCLNVFRFILLARFAISLALLVINIRFNLEKLLTNENIISIDLFIL